MSNDILISLIVSIFNSRPYHSVHKIIQCIKKGEGLPLPLWEAKAGTTPLSSLSSISSISSINITYKCHNNYITHYQKYKHKKYIINIIIIKKHISHIWAIKYNSIKFIIKSQIYYQN